MGGFSSGWEEAALMRTPRRYMAACEVGGRVVVAREDEEAEVFAPEAGWWSPTVSCGGVAVARYEGSCT